MDYLSIGFRLSSVGFRDAGSWMVVFVGQKRFDLVTKESMSVS